MVALYRLLAPAFINGSMQPEGTDNVAYDGEPGSTLEPMNEEAKRAKKAALLNANPGEASRRLQRSAASALSNPNAIDDGVEMTADDIAALQKRLDDAKAKLAAKEKADAKPDPKAVAKPVDNKDLG